MPFFVRPHVSLQLARNIFYSNGDFCALTINLAVSANAPYT